MVERLSESTWQLFRHYPNAHTCVSSSSLALHIASAPTKPSEWSSFQSLALEGQPLPRTQKQRPKSALRGILTIIFQTQTPSTIQITLHLHQDEVSGAPC